ncbi:MAG: hypothetical protein LBU35_03570, partial [Holosporales bacterium]|nr:hypothetical protein [Holosporales bacterium]
MNAIRLLCLLMNVIPLLCQSVLALNVKPIYDRNFEIFQTNHQRDPQLWFMPNGRLGNGEASQTSIINVGDAYKDAWETRNINTFETTFHNSARTLAPSILAPEYNNLLLLKQTIIDHRKTGQINVRNALQNLNRHIRINNPEAAVSDIEIYFNTLLAQSGTLEEVSIISQRELFKETLRSQNYASISQIPNDIRQKLSQAPNNAQKSKYLSRIILGEKEDSQSLLSIVLSQYSEALKRNNANLSNVCSTIVRELLT